MSVYLIAATAAELARNEGTEIMASSTTEAVAKYRSMGGQPCPVDDWVRLRLPDGTETTADWEIFDDPEVTDED